METHNQLKSYFNTLVTVFSSSLGSYEDAKLPFQREDHEWKNFFYSTSVTRHAHLEYYKTNRMCVLHANVFPNPLVELPILGFDAIALGDKITGIFFDFTPTSGSKVYVRELQDLKQTIKSPFRDLPEWANFFSDNFICVTPNPEEIESIFQKITMLVKQYVDSVVSYQIQQDQSIFIQNNYCIGQKKNDKTYKSLAAEIGEDNAKLFLNNFLFPEIKK
jgi:hypothetical protein